jgi:sialate O-acetylesterase
MHCPRTSAVERMIVFVAMILVMASAPMAQANIRLPAIIGDNMVLQRGIKAPLWGWADPDEEVRLSVSWHRMERRTTADADGKWAFALKTPPAGGPYEIMLAGKNTITLRNIMAGEVWVCSGQSNMEWPLHSVINAEAEVAAADHPNIRLFTVQKKIANAPEADCTGQWSQCNPETVPGFSAVGYFFGRYLQKELGVPVGLINTSWGGTVAEAWTSSEALAKMSDFKALMDRIAEARANPDASMKKYKAELAEWQKKIEVAGAQGKGCIEPDFDDSSWPEMDLPTLWDQAALSSFDGLVWFRKTIEVPNSWVGKELVLELGPIDDQDTTWVNGVKVGAHAEPGQWQALRKYTIDANVIRAGRNVIAVQVLDTGGGGGIYGQPEQMKLKSAGAGDDKAIALAGKWRYKVGYDLASMPPLPQPPVWVNNPNAPTVLYNGMIVPLVPFGIRGAIWYQGESNADRAYQYRELFPTMITNWRQDWGLDNFPFLFVQLANYMPTKPEPGESNWAELREAQTMTLGLPNTGMATIIDIGEANDIHPKNKQDVGKRLALWALAETHGKDIVYSGPLYKSMEIKGKQVVLHFEHIGGGLVAQSSEDRRRKTDDRTDPSSVVRSPSSGPLKGFAIAGSDRKFVWAQAEIKGSTVVVSSDAVAEPVAVRYAWADNPVCNLYNKSGLPASPFRTDDWPGLTANSK